MLSKWDLDLVFVPGAEREDNQNCPHCIATFVKVGRQRPASQHLQCTSESLHRCAAKICYQDDFQAATRIPDRFLD